MWSLMDKIKFKPVCILMDFNHMRVWERKNRYFFSFFLFIIVSDCFRASKTVRRYQDIVNCHTVVKRGFYKDKGCARLSLDTESKTNSAGL